MRYRVGTHDALLGVNQLIFDNANMEDEGGSAIDGVCPPHLPATVVSNAAALKRDLFVLVSRWLAVRCYGDCSSSHHTAWATNAFEMRLGEMFLALLIPVSSSCRSRPSRVRFFIAGTKAK